jgi:predicted nucleic acid-binding protein
MDVFVDTNVLIDVLAKREPFFADSFRLWTLAEQGRFRALVSVISFNNVHYIVRKTTDLPAARRAMRLLRDTFEPVPFDERLLHQAIDSNLSDFEDAIQFFSALRAGADCLVTRNPRHFPADELPILTPAEFLAAHFPADGTAVEEG